MNTTAKDTFVTLTIDITKATTMVQRYQQTMAEAARDLYRLADEAHRHLNTPAKVARTQGRYIALAGLSEVYHDPEGRDWLVQRIMAGTYPDTALLSRENRALVAVSAIRGWVTTHG